MEALIILFSVVWFVVTGIVAARGFYIRSGARLTITTNYGANKYRDRYGHILYDKWGGYCKPSEEDYEYERIRGAKQVVRSPLWPFAVAKWLGLLLARAGKGLGMLFKDATRELEQ